MPSPELRTLMTRRPWGDDHSAFVYRAQPRLASADGLRCPGQVMQPQKTQQ